MKQNTLLISNLLIFTLIQSLISIPMTLAESNVLDTKKINVYLAPSLNIGQESIKSNMTKVLEINKALDLLSLENPRLFTEKFRGNILKDPYILDNYRLTDMLLDEKAANPKLIAGLIKLLYPEGNNTEFINVYADVIDDPNKEPNPIGIGSIKHTHFAPVKADSPNVLVAKQKIGEMQRTTGKLPFVHAAVTAFILMETESGEYELISTARATTKSHPGKIESVSGGHIGAGENIITTVTRELAEELGIVITASELVGYKRYEAKDKDNTHDFVGFIILNIEQRKAMLSKLAEKGIVVESARSLDNLEKIMPDHIHEKIGRTPEELTTNLAEHHERMPGGKEVAYVILSPFDLLVEYYRKLKTESVELLIKRFAWIEKLSKEEYKDGNFLGNEELISSALSKFDTFQNESQLTRFITSSI